MLYYLQSSYSSVRNFFLGDGGNQLIILSLNNNINSRSPDDLDLFHFSY